MKFYLTVVGLAAWAAMNAAEPAKPNIVYILADDLGYGDVQSLNPGRSRIPTPHIDRLVAQGMSFSEAHSASSVCTPTRYGILTGRYSWRTRLQSGVTWGYDEPLIAPDRLTVASLLGRHGYTSAVIGKWHLGLDLREGDPNPVIGNGPTTRGFDRFFGIGASLDMPPYAYIENDRFTEPLTKTSTWFRSGPTATSFEAVDVLSTVTRKAVEFVRERAGKGQPFFLYLPLASPHTPILPSAAWQGRSGLGAYGDFVMETDWAVGEVLAALEQAGIAENTLVIFTSDNGCSPRAGIPELEAQGHFPNGDRRGMKADIFDGGHRVPFVTRWPGKIRAGSTSDHPVCLTDFLATCADLLGAKLEANAGEDSVSLLPLMLEQPGGSRREVLVHHSINGSFAIREGRWKLALCPDSGGWSEPKPGTAEASSLPATQLYDLSVDPAETRNLHAEHPEVVGRLTARLERIVAEGRSTPGPPRANDARIELRKPAPKP